MLACHTMTTESHTHRSCGRAGARESSVTAVYMLVSYQSSLDYTRLARVTVIRGGGGDGVHRCILMI